MSGLPVRISLSLFTLFLFGLLSIPVTAEAAGQARPYRLRADYVLIEKAKRKMTLYRNGHRFRTYQISLGKGGIEPKVREGDMRTPEGKYVINGRNPESKYHLSLRISYPSEEDKRRAASMGVPPGGDIMIHGLGTGASWWENVAYKFKDWTAGCVAVTNREIEEIWQLVPDGTPVEIRR